MPAIRGPGGRFLSKKERAAQEQQEQVVETPTKGNTQPVNPNNKEPKRMSEIKFVDELPRISRTVESGVWVERLAPLYDHQGQWAQVYGPTNNPHAVINNLRSGNAAGVEADDFSFAGRVLGTSVEVDSETGEEKEVNEGYVFARYDTDEQRAERIAKQRQRAEKRAATLAAKAEA